MLRLFLQQPLHFGALRCTNNTAEARAFEPGGRTCERQRFSFGASLGERKGKGTMKDIAGRERIRRLDREGRRVPRRVAGAPQGAVAAISDRHEASAHFTGARESRGEILEPRRCPQGFGGKDRVGCKPKQRIVARSWLVDIEHDWDAADTSSLAYCNNEAGKMIVHEQRIDAVEHALGCVRPRRCKGIVASRGQQSLTVAIEENARDARSGSRKAHGANGINTCVREALEHTRAMLVGSKRTGKPRASAQPRNRNRGVGRTTASGGQKFKHRSLGVGRGKALDAKDEVEHRNART